MVTVGTLGLHVLASWVCILAFGPLGASVGFVVSAVLSLTAYFLVGQRVYGNLIPMAEIGKALIGLAVFAPFAIYADQLESAFTSLTWLVVGGVVFLGAMIAIKQTAAQLIWTRVLGLRR